MKIKIMIVDDHSMVATGLARELDGQQDFQVTSVITSPAQVANSLVGTAPDVILMDIRMGVYNGIKMTIEYSVTDKESGELRCVGETSHCFLNREGKPVSLKKSYLEMDKMFQKALPQNEKDG